MTHEELLDCIDKFDAAVIIGQPAIKALRAVVELHKPMKIIGSNALGAIGCFHCNHGNFFTESTYPCPTIQAIERELA